jgi:hypothetical protein
LDKVISTFLLISVYRTFGSVEKKAGGLLEEDWIEHCILAIGGHLTHQTQEVWANFPKPINLIRALAAFNTHSCFFPPFPSKTFAGGSAILDRPRPFMAT